MTLLRATTGDPQAVPAVVHLRIFAPGDFIFLRGPAVEATIQSDEREPLCDGVLRRCDSGAALCPLPSFNDALVMYAPT